MLCMPSWGVTSVLDGQAMGASSKLTPSRWHLPRLTRLVGGTTHGSAPAMKRLIAKQSLELIPSLPLVEAILA